MKIKNLFILIAALMFVPIQANAQVACAEGQFYGCGSFNNGGFNSIENSFERRTICCCFETPDEPVEPEVGIRSCRNECPINDGIRTKSGCECLREPVVIPGRATPAISSSELKALYKLKSKNADLYQIYIDTQLSGNNSQPPMPVEKFIDLAN